MVTPLPICRCRKVILYTEEIFGSEKRWVPFIVLADHTDRIWDLRFSWDGNLLASAAWDNMVHIYRTSDLLPSEAPVRPELLGGIPFVLNRYGYVPEEGDVQSTRSAGPHSRRESVQSDHADYKSARLTCLAKVWTVAFQPKAESPVLVTGAADHSIRIWSSKYVNDWKQQAVLEGHTNTVTGVRPSNPKP